MCEISDKLSNIRTFIALPVDSFNNHVFPKQENCQIIKNAITGSLPDGIMHIVDRKNENESSELQNQNLLQNQIILVGENDVYNNTLEVNNDSEIQHKSNSVYNCLKCKEVFNEVGLYYRHMLEHQGIKKYKCTKCSAGYNMEINLTIHMAMHGEGKPTCPICKTSFQRLASLKSHLMLHQVEEFYTCEECAAEFEKEDELFKHLHNHTVTNTENNLVCSYCSVQFDDRKAYREHISHHIKVKKMVLSGKKSRRVCTNREHPHVCSVCLKRFSRISLLERHLRVHSGERPFVCPHCSRAFNQKGTLQIHLSKHTGIKPFHCTLCSAKFNQKGNLRVHVEKTHTAPMPGVKIYKCSHCTCIFKKIASLNVHITKSHATIEDVGNISNIMSRLKELEEQTAVTLCTKTTDKKIQEQNKTALSEMKRGDTSNMSYVQLAESFLDGTVRQYLVAQKKVNDVRWYVCNYCSKEFKKPSDLIRHTRVHTREKPFVCKQCGASFSLKSTLFCHVKTHSSNGYLCSICLKEFSSMRSLNLHLRRHLEKENQEYKCDKCNKYFDSLRQIKKHNDEDHSSQVAVNESLLDTSRTVQSTRSSKFSLEHYEQNVKQFECEVCNLRFTKMPNLNHHIRVQREERKFQCDRCFKSYYTAYSLKTHLLCHSGVKNYVCKICGKNYVTASLLKRHALTHNICFHCNKDFRSGALCKKHKNIHKRKLNIQGDIALNESKNVQCTSGPNSIDLIQMSETNNLQEMEEFEKTAKSNLYETERTDFINSSTSCEIQYKTFEGLDLLTSQPPLHLLTNVDKNVVQDSNPVHKIFINSVDAQLASNLNSQISDSILFNSLNDIHEEDVLNAESLNENIGVQNAEIYISNEIFNINQAVVGDKANIKNNTPTNLTNKIFNLNNSNLMHCKTKQDKGNIISNAEDAIDHDVFFYSELNLFSIASELETNNYDYLSNGKLNLTDINASKRQQSSSETFQQNISVIKDDKATRETFNYDKRKKVYLNNCNHHTKHTDSHKAMRKKKGIKLHHCNFCSKDFKKQSDLTRHIRTHTGEKPFACDNCDKSFSLKSTLVSHQRTHNPISHKHYNCIVCNSFFTSKSSLKVHMSVHTGDKTHECRFCPIKFRTAAHRKSHEINHHINPSKKKKNKVTNLLASVAMDVINNQTLVGLRNNRSVTNEALENILVVQEQLPISDHQLNDSNTYTSSESNPLESVLLQQFQPSFLPTENLISPSIIQLADGTILNVKYTEIQELNEKRIDTSTEKLRKFECEICGKKYGSKDVLRRHKKIHGVNKKFPCTKCDKGFNLKGELEKHDRTHIGFRPYSCMYCSNSFAKEHSLTVHIKRIHNVLVKGDNLLLDNMFRGNF